MRKKFYKKVLFLVIIICLLIPFSLSLKFENATVFAKQGINNKVLIYNTHPDEVYLDNKNIKDISKELNKLLINKGIESNFLDISNSIDKSKQFENSRALIEKSAIDDKNLILLDIHYSTQENYPTSNRKITIVLAGNSPNLGNNKSFSELLGNRLGNPIKNYNVTYDIQIMKNALGYFNQDLSNRAILIEIGTKFSSEKDRNDCIKALSEALKNL